MMKTRYKIVVGIILLYVVIVEVDNYFNGSLHQTSIHQSVGNPSECWDQEDDGSMTPCEMGLDEFYMAVATFWVMFGPYVVVGIAIGVIVIGWRKRNEN